MVKILDLIDPQCIKLELKSRKKKELVKEMVDLLFQAGKIKEKEKVEESMMEREKKGSSGIGEGVAIPHIMSSKVSQTLMAFGQSKKGINFASIDGKPIYLVFILVGPARDAMLHLKILAKLCRFLHNSLFKQALLKANSKEEIIQAFTEEEKREG
jgi:fructose-specific phosphotransferase system IIA component